MDMDIEKLVDEVVRRLMILIEKEQARDVGSVDTVSGATTVAPRCSKAAAGKKILVTEAEAMEIKQNSTVNYPKGTIITPLAKDVFKQRNVKVVCE